MTYWWLICLFNSFNDISVPKVSTVFWFASSTFQVSGRQLVCQESWRHNWWRETSSGVRWFRNHHIGPCHDWGRSIQGIRIRLLLLTRRSHEGCYRNEWSHHRCQAIVCCSGSTQGRQEGSFGISVHAEDVRNEDAANGTGIKNVLSLQLRYRII